MNADNLIKLENNLALLYGRESTPTIEKLKLVLKNEREDTNMLKAGTSLILFLSLMVAHLKGLIVGFPYCRL